MVLLLRGGGGVIDGGGDVRGAVCDVSDFVGARVVDRLLLLLLLMMGGLFLGSRNVGELGGGRGRARGGI